MSASSMLRSLVGYLVHKQALLGWVLATAIGCSSSSEPSSSGAPSDEGGTPSTSGSGAGGGGAVASAGVGIFPSTAPWYQDVTQAALDSQSADVISGLSMAGGWGNGNKFQIDSSIEVLAADASVARRAFTPTDDFYNPDCDKVDVPVPAGGRVEGESGYACTGDGDCHLIVVQGMRLYEMWRANITGDSTAGFQGGCLAVWDLSKDYWTPAAPPSFARGDHCTSADAAGYPIAALLFSADEVKAGEIKHAIRFILPNDRIDPKMYVHPATHATMHSATATTPVPYGARLRLKSSFDLASLPSDGARVVARALMHYGMFLADGGNIALTAQSDTYTQAKWDGLLDPHDLASLKVTDFEMVDGGTRYPLAGDCSRTPLTQ
jgi:serine/threonine-protein kinase